MIHRLKTWSDSFRATLEGRKSHEVRLNNRDFAVDDTIVLCEWLPAEEQYTGREIEAKILFITGRTAKGPPGKDRGVGIEVKPILHHGLEDRWVVLDIRLKTLPPGRPHISAKDGIANYFSEHGCVWNVERLWRLAAELTPFDKDVDSFFEWDDWVWEEDLTLLSFSKHVQRVLDADFSKPIILNADGGIMDGFHRVIKARLDGLTTVKAVQFAINPKPDLRKKEDNAA